MEHTTPPAAGPLSGRKAQAARNDRLILDAARAVFLADPTAPISAVAERAGVGISALYRRYAGKEDLLRTLCGEGLRRYIAAAQVMLAAEGDTWDAFTCFMRGLVDADSRSLTQRLAGAFTPTPELHRLAGTAHDLTERILARVQAAHAIRPDVDVHDLTLVLQQLAGISVGDERRTHQLRHRYLALVLDALRHPSPASLPGPAPTAAELSQRRIT